MEQVSSRVSVAIQAFSDLVKAERLVDRKRQELNAAIAQVPREEVGIYMELTNRIEEASMSVSFH